MNRPAKLPFAMCLTIMLAVAGSEITSAAENEAPTQVLVQEDIPDQVTTANWTRLPDAYVLRVVLDRPATPRRPERAIADQPAPAITGGEIQRTERGSFFIGNSVASLRGLDPAFGCRTLTLVAGRRVVSGQQPAPASAAAPAAAPSPDTMNQPYPPKLKDPRVDVWLLKADGTQILPATYSCDLRRPGPDMSRPHAEISYEFPLANTAQAVAAAIRIEDRYFIQKL
jgi:hypothetical protein